MKTQIKIILISPLDKSALAVIRGICACPFSTTICLDISKDCLRKIVNIFFAIILSICFGCSKEPSH